MVFEYHDDIVVFDSQNDPSEVIFYQVKSKTSGNWTIGALTKENKGSPSILAKLYDNYQSFPENTTKLVFTSNQPLSTKLKNGDKALEMKRVKFSQLSNKDKEKLQSALEPESQNFCNIHGLQKIETEKNDLRIDDHSVTTKGKLVEFFEKVHPESEINISLVYKTFFDEIRRKSNYEKKVDHTADLLAHKSIGRSEFQTMIGAVTQRTSDSDLWQEASHVLNAESFSFHEIRKIKSSWQQYIVNKMNVTDDLHLRLSDDVLSVIECPSRSNTNTLKELVDSSLPFLMEAHSENYDEPYVKAAIVYEALRNDPISEVDKKPKDKTK
ncbi:dsDNA nuclease domain-containing protein (plasmid) [Maricurvus nonylphenolicus]